MIQIFYGNDRIRIQEEVKRFFVTGYEVVEGGALLLEDLPNIFRGSSLFNAERHILIKDLSDNKALWEKLGTYINSDNNVIIWETKLDKRTATYKELKAHAVKMKEFNEESNVNVNGVFDIFDVAMRDGKTAVRMLEKIESTEDPYMFFGLIVSQALKRYGQNMNKKGKGVLKELSNVDMQMKSTSVQPWLLVKSFLLQLSLL